MVCDIGPARIFPLSVNALWFFLECPPFCATIVSPSVETNCPQGVPSELLLLVVFPPLSLWCIYFTFVYLYICVCVRV